MYFVYSLVLTIGFILLLPRFALDALRHGKYVTGLRERLGAVPKINSEGRSVVWLHCVSVGEARAALSLVRALKSRFPHLVLVVSTTTVTGQAVAKDIFRDQAAAVFYFPIDWAWTVRRVLATIKPAAILVMETELWPRLFREASTRRIPVALVNGRISDKSFRRYKLVRSFIARVLNDLTLAVMQSESDAERVRELGMPGSRLRVSGNVKFDSASSVNEVLTSDIRDRFGFTKDSPLIVAASTHHPEEAVLLAVFKKIREQHSTARLVIAPRHPERFDEVASLLVTSGLRYTRRSSDPAGDDAAADIVLLDSIGELGAVYPLADVAFVGGSIAPHGGHSVIEPATHGVCTITGPHTGNFAAVTDALVQAGGLIQLSDSSDTTAQLTESINRLLNDETQRHEIGRRGQAVCQTNRGATERTLDLISPILSASPAQANEELSLSPLHATAAK